MSEAESYDYILNDFKEILDNFKIESKKPFKGNEFAAKMRNEIAEDFENFISSLISDNEKYHSKISPGMMDWSKVPWAGFYHKEVTDTFQTGFYLIYLFESDGTGFTLSLGQGVNDSNKLLTQRGDYLNRIIEEHPLDVPDGFKKDDDIPERIISKFYNKEDLNTNELVEDLMGMIKIYEYLIPYYTDFRAAEEPSKKDLRPKDSGRKIWRIAPGNADVYNYAWEEFKKDSYVGIGFKYEEPEVDYTQFKNKYSMDKYLDKYDIKAPSKLMLWKFVNWVKKGDIVIVNKGRSKFAGIGVINGSFIPSTENEKRNEYDLNNVYPVKWVYTPDDLEVTKNLFARHTLVEWDGDKWNKLLCIIARNDNKLKEKILRHIYDESYQLLFEREDFHHNLGYQKESEEINKVWKEIVQKYENNEPIADDIWNKLVNRENKVHLDGSRDIKASIKGRLKLSDKEMDETAILLFETLYKLKDNDDIDDQKRILKEYAENKYSGGIKSGRLSSILYYLDDNYLVINKKTVETVKLLSLMFGDEIKLSLELKRYIINNNKYKEFLEKLKNAIDYTRFDIGNFEIFDTICHYLCSNSTIHYATKEADLMPIDFYIDVDKVLSDDFVDEDPGDEEDGETPDGESPQGEIDDIPEVSEALNLTPEILESKLKSFSIADATLNQLCASLNAGKNIILDGTPGTGKTELAIKFATAASDYNFINGHILTTATSDWSTFDTIGGLMPNEKGELFFYPGKFLDAIAENKWLIIDEINRADIDKAFGQLFTVLSKQDVELPYKENDKPIKIKLWDENYSKHDEEKATYYIGNNWRIIGTMNVDDKDSLFDLSYAFMRRFMFIEVDLPDEEAYKELIRKWANDLSEEYLSKLLRVYEVIRFRKLGPAIFKDMTEYIKFRDEISDDSTDLILAEAISSYIVPQFEGLNRNKIEQIRKLIGDIGLSSYLDEELEALIPKF